MGDNCKLYSTATSNPVGINHKCIIRTLLPGASIDIGNNVGMSGATLLARVRIVVEDSVLIGPNCVITDSDHHPVDPGMRIINDSKNISEAPVRIKKNVWLGMNVLVFKGVVIGENTVVGAGSVVLRSLPANVLAAGNPAKVIRYLDDE